MAIILTNMFLLASNCEAPQNVKNGQLFDLNNGAVVITRCNTGFKLKGSRRRHCDGYRWRGTRPKCHGTKNCCLEMVNSIKMGEVQK